eukprot:comp9885_c0_seq1/m.4821 comp9885_c0_seq1/g.4821  ORF comp9885_c0_seq1/g.4821 comp9885_c0_seq1/m.4821 type:complete len:227 (-) comp9885_c0_seq1:596-1276(-)
MSSLKQQHKSSTDLGDFGLEDCDDVHRHTTTLSTTQKMPHFPQSDIGACRLRVPEEKKDWFAAFQNSYKVRGRAGNLVKVNATSESSSQSRPPRAHAEQMATLLQTKTCPSLPRQKAAHEKADSVAKRHSSLKKPSLGTWQEGQEGGDTNSDNGTHATSPPTSRMVRRAVVSSLSDSGDSSAESCEELSSVGVVTGHPTVCANPGKTGAWARSFGVASKPAGVFAV